MTRLMGSGRVGKILWRMTYPGRNPSSPRALVKKFVEDGATIVASVDPLPSSSPPTEAVDGPLMNRLKGGSSLAGGRAYKDGDYSIEMDAMTSPAMKALGVEVCTLSFHTLLLASKCLGPTMLKQAENCVTC